MTLEQKWWEQQVLENFPQVGNDEKPDYITANIMMEWINHAHQRGDMSYKELTNGKPLYAPYVTYHDNG